MRPPRRTSAMTPCLPCSSTAAIGSHEVHFYGTACAAHIRTETALPNFEVFVRRTPNKSTPEVSEVGAHHPRGDAPFRQPKRRRVSGDLLARDETDLSPADRAIAALAIKVARVPQSLFRPPPRFRRPLEKGRRTQPGAMDRSHNANNLSPFRPDPVGASLPPLRMRPCRIQFPPRRRADRMGINLRRWQRRVSTESCSVGAGNGIRDCDNGTTAVGF